jgi:Zn-dependent metalloprotease
MKRTTAVAAAIAATLTFSLVVGRAQQPSRVQIRATTGNELRTWDGWVTQALRSGELRASRVDRDPLLPTRAIERLQQYHNGVPIWGSQIVRDSSNGVAESIFGELSPPLTIGTEPALQADAINSRFAALAGPDGKVLRAPALTILRLESGEHRLAYQAVVSNKGVFRIFVDAQTGGELLRYSEIQTQSAVGTGRGTIGDTKKMSVLKQGEVYVADDRMRPPILQTFDMRGDPWHAYLVSEFGFPLFASDLASDSDNDWTDPAAVDAHAYLGWTYDYYFKRFGRRGLDDRDRPVIALINPVLQKDAALMFAEWPYYVANASWCGECGPNGVGVMLFGNGIPPQYTLDGQTVTYFAASLDIVAHELTHGVTDSSSDLIYLNESGALNEAFSDIMGASVEFYHQQFGAGIGQADYLIGEDTFRSPGGALNGIRSMVNPTQFGQPDHYSIRFIGPEDNGWVHYNSGIANHAFFLAIEGGTHRLSGIAVQGVGRANREQMEKIFYRAFVYLLPANATFATARAATIQAARDLYGAGSAAERAVTLAWTAVGVF